MTTPTTPVETVSRWLATVKRAPELVYVTQADRDAIAALAKAERERAEPKPDPYGWIEWRGGMCPVSTEFVDVKLRDGTPVPMARAFNCYWDHKGKGNDIIAYRILPSQVTK